MAQVTCAVVAKLFTLRESYMDDLEDEGVEVDQQGLEGGGMIKMGVLGGMLVDWTDSRKILDINGTAGSFTTGEGKMLPHFALAEMVLERLVTTQISKEERKVLFAMLGKLYLPAGGCEAEQVKVVLELAAEAADGKAAPDAVSRNVLTKVQNGLLKTMHDFMSAERGGGGVDETEAEVGEVTEMVGELDVSTVGADDEEEEGDGEESQADVDEQLAREMSTTLGATIGVPDAEGTRFDVGEEYTVTEIEDSEMMDVDG